MKKRLAGIVLCAIMCVGMVFPSMAYESRGMLDSTEIHRESYFNWASGKREQYPGWNWVNGYCYYLKNMGGEKLTSCVTPDGYTVDEEGRWTVDGVPQYNGYGNLVVGTDELYAGKNDDERWTIIHDKLEKLYAENVPGNEMFYAMRSTEMGVSATVGGTIKPNIDVINNVHSDKIYYIEASFVNHWNDSPEVYVSHRNEVIEQTIRLICGDHVGQELFEDLRKAAEPAEGPTLLLPVYDENGRWIEIGDGRIETKTVEHTSDGVNFNYFDLNKWNGRQTDYGKTISITYDPSDGNDWRIGIY